MLPGLGEETEGRRGDGSSTVFPITEAVAEEFQKTSESKVTVGISGTGGGFKKLCTGETDISDASRPIKPSEVELCQKNGVKYVELPIAYDGLAILVNPKNDWAAHMTVAELKRLWQPEAQGQIKRWNQVRDGWPDKRVMGMGRSLLAGASTLALLLLPMVIMASREALRTVPHSMREASYALGADRWQTLRRVTLPMCLPGILTGIILSLARAIGETAPLITIGALTYIAFLPDSLDSAFTALPIQIFNWVSRPQADFHANAAAGIVVLLALMLLLNGVAIWLRNRLQRRIYW
jgi:hypothetical protein